MGETLEQIGACNQGIVRKPTITEAYLDSIGTRLGIRYDIAKDHYASPQERIRAKEEAKELKERLVGVYSNHDLDIGVRLRALKHVPMNSLLKLFIYGGISLNRVE